MISNERPSPFKGLPQMQPRPPVHEETLKFEQVEIEHKSFVFTLKENLRGRFLRITEKTVDGFVCLIIPDSGLDVFKQRLDKMVKAASEPPPAAIPDLAIPLKTEQVQVERKNFVFALDQDLRGPFLRITENCGSRSSDLLIPASGLGAFRNLMAEMVKAANEQSLDATTGMETQPRTPSVEETLKAGQMQLERRAVTFALKKNPHGRFLRITTEEKDGRYNSLIIPAEGLEEFKKWVVEMAKASKKLKE
jgi:PurA ssDNA and RNA-binding protein